MKNKKTSSPKKAATKNKYQSKLEWLPKKTFSLEFSIPWKDVKKTYEKTLEDFTKDADVKGFRKGKAPKDVVEKSIDSGKIYGEVVNQLLPISYAKAIHQHQLKPAVNPKVNIIKAEPNQDWEFKATACELPEVKLGNYQKAVKEALATSKIWTPAKGDPKDKPAPEQTESQRLETISKALIADSKIELPDLLVNQEKDRLLAKLLGQIEKLGITIDQYTASAGKTVEQLKTEYQVIAKDSLKIELILQKIADERKIKIEDKEIQAMIDASGDEKIKQQLNTPSEKAYLNSILRKRKVIDYLISL